MKTYNRRPEESERRKWTTGGDGAAMATATATFDPTLVHQPCSSSPFYRTQIDFFNLINCTLFLKDGPFSCNDVSLRCYRLTIILNFRLNINNSLLNVASMECSRLKSYSAIWSGWTFVSLEIAIYRFSADTANSCRSFAGLPATFRPME